MQDDVMLLVVAANADDAGRVDVAVARIDVSEKRVDWLSLLGAAPVVSDGLEPTAIELVDAGIRELRWWAEEKTVLLADFTSDSSIERGMQMRYKLDVLDFADILVRIKSLDGVEELLDEFLANASATDLLHQHTSAALFKPATATLVFVLDRFAFIQESAEGDFEFSLRDLRSALCLRFSPSAMRVFGETGPSNGEESIFSVIARACSTKQGKRRLRKWIARPSVDVDELRKRHDSVERFVTILDPSSSTSASKEWLESLVRILRHFQTFETKAVAFVRLSDEKTESENSARLSLTSFAELSRWVRETGDAMGKFNDSVQDFAALQQDVQRMLPFCDLLDFVYDTECSETVRHRYRNDSNPMTVHAVALRNLRTELDACKRDIEHSVDQIAEAFNLQRTRVRVLYDEDDQPGFPSTGVVLRIARQDGHRVHHHNGKRVTIYRASKAIGVWFTVASIEHLGARWKTLRDSYRTAERDLIQVLVKTFTDHYCTYLARIIHRVGEFDVLMAYALVARQHNFVRAQIPIVNRNKLISMNIVAPFNPMHINRNQQTNWDIRLDHKHHFLLLEGEEVTEGCPLLYVIGTIALLNQVGCFVPCKSAVIPIFDAILLRSGAYDQQLHGLSTFMTEMKEMALIFSSMTPSSLVLIDDLCRGTASSTKSVLNLGEGLRVAISTCSHLIERQAVVCLSSQWRELTGRVKELNHVCMPSSELAPGLSSQLENQRFHQLLVDCEVPRELIELIHQELEEQVE